MQIIMTLGNGVTVTATPRIENGMVLLDLHADTPSGPVDMTAKTSVSAVQAMIARKFARLSPQIAAYIDRVRGLSSLPPMPRETMDMPESVDMGSMENPFLNMTGLGESVSAGQWSYNPYFVRMPIRYRVIRRWQARPWWWPVMWAWPGYLNPNPYPYYGYPYGYPNQFGLLPGQNFPGQFPGTPYNASGAYTGPQSGGTQSQGQSMAGASRSMAGCAGSCGGGMNRFRF